MPGAVANEGAMLTRDFNTARQKATQLYDAATAEEELAAAKKSANEKQKRSKSDEKRSNKEKQIRSRRETKVRNRIEKQIYNFGTCQKFPGTGSGRSSSSSFSSRLP